MGNFAMLGGLLISIPVAIAALETPYTPYKDGHADVSSYNGSARTLEIRAGDSKGWVVHAVSDGSGQGLLKARLSLFVKDVIRDGTLRINLASSLGYLENQTRLEYLKSSDSLGSISIRAADHVQGMVSIPLGQALVSAIKDGNYTGLILEGANGLDAELGAIEGGRGALLYLEYEGGTGMSQALVDTVAKTLAARHAEALRGPTGSQGPAGPQGPAGAVGPQGQAGAIGPQGPAGAIGPQGVKGDKGDKGDAADQAPIFQLLVDRGSRATYEFDGFSSATPRTTPDASGNGNTLTLSTDGVNRIQIAPGDSAVQFLGNGYASAANSLSLNPYSGITLTARIRLSLESPPDTQTLVHKQNQYGMAVVKNGDKGRLMAWFKTALSEGAWVGAGNLTYGDTSWIDVQVSYDGRAIRAAVNGSQTFQMPYSQGPLALDSNQLYLGAQAGGNHGLKGFLNQVKILGYAKGASDSLSVMPGRATRAQLALDSVPGLQAALDSKANLSGAVFTGRIQSGTDTAGRAAIVKVDGNGNANMELRAHGQSPYIDFANNRDSDHNTRIILGPDSVFSIQSSKSVAITPGLNVAGPIRREGHTVLDRGNMLVVSRLFQPAGYWAPTAVGISPVTGFSVTLDVPVAGTLVAQMNALIRHTTANAALYVGPAIDGTIANANYGGYRNNIAAGDTPQWFGTAAFNSKQVAAGSHTVQVQANIDMTINCNVAWGYLVVQFFPD